MNLEIELNGGYGNRLDLREAVMQDLQNGTGFDCGELADEGGN